MNAIWLFAAKVAAGLLGISGFAYYVCHLAEGGLSVAAREKVIHSLETLRFAPSIRAAFQSFTFAADGAFGHKLFSVRAFIVSTVWTVAWIVALLSFATFFASDRPPITFFLTVVFRYNFLLIGAAVIIDFVCLTKTRLLIRWSLPRGLSVVAICAGVDLIISIVLFYFLFSFAFFFAAFLFGEEVHTFWAYFQKDVLYLWSRPIEGISYVASWPAVGSKLTSPSTYTFVVPPAPFFWSSMTTSVWMVLYLTAYLTMAAAVRIDLIKSKVLPALNLSQKPFSAIGLVIVALSVIIGMAVVVVFSILN